MFLGKIIQIIWPIQSKVSQCRTSIAPTNKRYISRKNSPGRFLENDPDLRHEYQWPNPKDHPLDIIFAREKSPDHPSYIYKKDGSVIYTRSLNDTDGHINPLELDGKFNDVSNVYVVRENHGRKSHKSGKKKSDKPVVRRQRDYTKSILDGIGKNRFRNRKDGKVNSGTENIGGVSTDEHSSVVPGKSQDNSDSKINNMSAIESAFSAVTDQGCSYLNKFMSSVRKSTVKLQNRSSCTKLQLEPCFTN